MPIRSWLFTPATRADRFDRAGVAGADALIIDLEDAVSAEHKTMARQSALGYLERHLERPFARALRINALATLSGLDDLRALLRSSARPDYIVLPKTAGPELPQLVAQLLEAAGKSIQLIALIESARGLQNAHAIARSTPHLHSLMFGAADMAADLGAECAWEPLLMARSRVVHAAAAAGIEAIDSPWFVIEDEPALKREAEAAKRLGFTGKAAIHPKQIDSLNSTFSPTPEQCANARAVLHANASGAGIVDGAMIDEAVARRARRTLSNCASTMISASPDR